MDLGVTKKVIPLIEAVREMVNDEIVTLEAEFYQEVENAGNRFSFTPRMTEILEGMNFIPLFVRKALEYIKCKD